MTFSIAFLVGLIPLSWVLLRFILGGKSALRESDEWYTVVLASVIGIIGIVTLVQDQDVGWILRLWIDYWLVIGFIEGSLIYFGMLRKPIEPILNFTTQVGHKFSAADVSTTESVFITIANRSRTFAKETEAELTIAGRKTIIVFKKRDIYNEGVWWGLAGATAIRIVYDQAKKEISIPYVERRHSDEEMIPKGEIFQDINLPCSIALTLRGDNLRLEDRKTKHFMLWREKGEIRFGSGEKYSKAVKEFGFDNIR